jgi:hypothetical protein
MRSTVCHIMNRIGFVPREHQPLGPVPELLEPNSTASTPSAGRPPAPTFPHSLAIRPGPEGD